MKIARPVTLKRKNAPGPKGQPDRREICTPLYVNKKRIFRDGLAGLNAYNLLLLKDLATSKINKKSSGPRTKNRRKITAAQGSRAAPFLCPKR